MILEVMGRDAGHIALSCGIAGGADVILIPEIPYDLKHVAAKIKAVKESGRNFALMVVSEAVKTESGEAVEQMDHEGRARYGGIAEYLCPRMTALTGSETRATVLGHLQRGAAPTWNDRLLAQALGVRAVDLVVAQKYDRMVAWQNRKVVDVPIADAIKECRTVDPAGTLVHTARSLGISFGDS